MTTAADPIENSGLTKRLGLLLVLAYLVLVWLPIETMRRRNLPARVITATAVGTVSARSARSRG